MCAGLWAARLKMVSRPRPAVPPVMKITLPAREGIVVVSKVVDMVEVEGGGLLRG